MFNHRVLLFVAVVVASYFPAASALAIRRFQPQRDAAARRFKATTVLSPTQRVNRLSRLGELRRRVA
jgi:hypothetical protein